MQTTVYLPPARLDRFWKRVNKDGPAPPHCPDLGPCWLWLGTKTSNGYGYITFGSRSSKHNVGAHRISYMLAHGRIPDGLHVLHHCDNPPCVNPVHLFAGTRSDNMADMGAKGRDGRTRYPERFPVGSAIKQAVLTEPQVVDIRERRAIGEPLRALARRFGISWVTVKRIVYGQQWKHAGGPITNGGQPASSTGERYIGYQASRNSFRVYIKRNGVGHYVYGLRSLEAAMAARDTLLARLGE